MAIETKWHLYPTNEEAWYHMLTDCARAKKSISLEQFIFTDDDFGKKLLDICSERASAGVRVRFLWDAAGSFTFWGTNIADRLKEKGIELVFWRTLIPSYFKVPNFRSWYFRNHRRTLVIDDEVGYTGSICIENQMRAWRDTNVRIEGKTVLEMSIAFERMWMRAKKKKPLPPHRTVRDTDFHYLTNDPLVGKRSIYSEVVNAIREAKKRVYITTPYFVPTHRMLRTIRTAAERGVDIRIIVPERSDHYIVDLGARAFFKTLMESGAKIFLYKGNMIHSKSIVVDDNWSTVGSMNLDSASLLYNFEANIVSNNEKFAKELVEHFDKDIAESKEITLEEWQRRFFLEKMMEFLVRMVKKFL